MLSTIIFLTIVFLRNRKHACLSNYCDKLSNIHRQYKAVGAVHVSGINRVATHLPWPLATEGGRLRAVCNLTSFLSSFPSAFFC